MSSESKPIFSLASGEKIEEKKVPAFQPVHSRSIRVNDAEYGLRAAAKIAHDRTELAEQRAAQAEWKRGRQEAIDKQRAKEQQVRAARVERLHDLEAEILRLQTAWESGTSSDPDKVKAKLLSLLNKRDALKAKIQ